MDDAAAARVRLAGERLMWLEGWHIEGFGQFAGQTTRGLPDGLVIVSGPNEAGESTLLHFIQFILFGRGKGALRTELTEALAGGRLGGRLFFRDEAGETIVERLDGQVQLIEPGKRTTDAEALGRWLGGMDAASFRAVFAVRHEDLAGLGGLDDDDVRKQLMAGGVSGAGRDVNKAQQRLGAAKDKLWRPRAQCSIRAELDRVRDRERQLVALRETAIDALRGAATRSKHARDLSEIRIAIEQHGTMIHGLRGLMQALEPDQELRSLEADLADLGPSGALPNALGPDLDVFETELRALDARRDALEERIAELEQRVTVPFEDERVLARAHAITELAERCGPLHGRQLADLDATLRGATVRYTEFAQEYGLPTPEAITRIPLQGASLTRLREAAHAAASATSQHERARVDQRRTDPHRDAGQGTRSAARTARARLDRTVCGRRTTPVPAPRPPPRAGPARVRTGASPLPGGRRQRGDRGAGALGGVGREGPPARRGCRCGGPDDHRRRRRLLDAIRTHRTFLRELATATDSLTSITGDHADAVKMAADRARELEAACARAGLPSHAAGREAHWFTLADGARGVLRDLATYQVEARDLEAQGRDRDRRIAAVRAALGITDDDDDPLGAAVRRCGEAHRTEQRWTALEQDVTVRARAAAETARAVHEAALESHQADGALATWQRLRSEHGVPDAIVGPPDLDAFIQRLGAARLSTRAASSRPDVMTSTVGWRRLQPRPRLSRSGSSSAPRPGPPSRSRASSRPRCRRRASVHALARRRRTHAGPRCTGPRSSASTSPSPAAAARACSRPLAPRPWRRHGT